MFPQEIQPVLFCCILASYKKKSINPICYLFSSLTTDFLLNFFIEYIPVFQNTFIFCKEGLKLQRPNRWIELNHWCLALDHLILKLNCRVVFLFDRQEWLCSSFRQIQSLVIFPWCLKSSWFNRYHLNCMFQVLWKLSLSLENLFLPQILLQKALCF